MAKPETPINRLPRPRARWRVTAALGVSLVVGLVVPAAAGGAQAAPLGHAPGNSSAKILEEDVTNNPSLNNGQPQIAVNPEHPNDLVFLSTNHDAAANAPVTDLTVFQCFLAYSTDGGVDGLPWLSRWAMPSVAATLRWELTRTGSSMSPLTFWGVRRPRFRGSSGRSMAAARGPIPWLRRSSSGRARG